MDQFIFSVDAARMLNISLEQIRQWCRNRVLHPEYYNCGMRMFRLEEIEALQKNLSRKSLQQK
jgi:DNA-binding transcriptional MerR regulator